MDKKLEKMTIDYHTYKNKLLETYPESIIDIQLVFEEDTFDFKKENGKVIYHHNIVNPFAKDKKPVGGYCVIKNRLGEFIEIMNDTEIQKCKQVAKMKNIWNTWETEMYLKTIIKRACKRFFYDVVKEIEDEDNKDYNLDLINAGIELITEEQKKEIDDLGVDKQKACTFIKVSSISEMTTEQAQKIIDIKKAQKK